MKKIAIVGVHGTGKSRICDNIIKYGIIEKGIEEEKISTFCRIPTVQKRPYHYFPNIIKDIEHYLNFAFIPEQFRKVVKDLKYSDTITLKQTEGITLATYAKQLYLENLHAAQDKNILCDRSVLDTFIYYDYFNNADRFNGNKEPMYLEHAKCFYNYRYSPAAIPIYSKEWQEGLKLFSKLDTFLIQQFLAYKNIKSYTKIYLIEPSDREIEDDGFRLTDKKQQFEIHKLFLEYFKDFNNVEIINQEEVHKEEFIEKVANEFVL